MPVAVPTPPDVADDGEAPQDEFVPEDTEVPVEDPVPLDREAPVEDTVPVEMEVPTAEGAPVEGPLGTDSTDLGFAVEESLSAAKLIDDERNPKFVEKIKILIIR